MSAVIDIVVISREDVNTMTDWNAIKETGKEPDSLAKVYDDVTIDDPLTGINITRFTSKSRNWIARKLLWCE